MTTDLGPAGLAAVRERLHGNCVVCGHSNKRGFRLVFTLSGDGSVTGTFSCDESFEGYSKFLHGGVISSLLDGAMTNCMFANGCISVTAELKVRFRHPVAVGVPATVRARIVGSRNRLHMVKAELLQDQEIKATAEGKFMEVSSLQDELEAANPNND